MANNQENKQGTDQDTSASPIGAQLEEIAKSGGVTAKTAKETIHCLSVIGQIEGHFILDSTQKTTKYEHVIPLLCAIEESEEIDGLLLILNTMGGDVEAGLAIAEMVASMKTPAGVAGAWRRPFDRRSFGGMRPQVLYCAQRHNDAAPGTYEWDDHRRSADLLLF